MTDREIYARGIAAAIKGAIIIIQLIAILCLLDGKI